MKVGEFEKEEYDKIRKRTQKAEKFYELVQMKGGREIIKYLGGVSVDMIGKLKGEEMENIVRKMNNIED